MPVGRHVVDGADADARCVHVDDELGETCVLRRIGIGSRDQVAPIRERSAAGPHLLAVDDPVVAVPDRPRAQRSDVTAGVGLAHADAPHRRARHDVGQPALPLFGRAELEERRPHLAVCKPGRGDGCAVGDERLVDDEPFEGRASVAAFLDGPRHPYPAARAEFLGEGGVMTDDPRVFRERRTRRPLHPERGGFVVQRVELGWNSEVHGAEPTFASGDHPTDRTRRVRGARGDDRRELHEARRPRARA